MRLAVGTALTVLVLLATIGGTSAAPDAPVLVTPSDDALDLPARTSLCVQVSDPAGLPLDVTFLGRDLGASPQSPFSIVVLPDSQFYSQSFPEIFLAQTQWVVDHRDSDRIAFVSHVGDIVHLAYTPEEWISAERAMGLLESPATTERPEGIPYGLSVGNHDQSPNNAAGYPVDPDVTTALYNATFGPSRFAGKSWFGGFMDDNNDNSYQLFDAAGMSFIAIHLEFDDTYFTYLPQQLQWLDDVLTSHAERRAIITSHSLLCGPGNALPCPATTWAEFSPQGQAIYDVAKHHANVFLMLCGHSARWDMQHRRSDTFGGHEIHTVLSNYHHAGQWCFNQFCGNGWMRVMEFLPKEDRIAVRTLSPWLGEELTEACVDGTSCHRFDLPYDMEGGVPSRVLGQTVGTASGATACLDWSGLRTGGAYEWHVVASNGTETAESVRWSFTASGTCSAGTECDDGDPCTQDSCAGSTCRHDPVPGCCLDAGDCDDGNWCTDDACVAGTCVVADATRPCDDGDPCTENDTCGGGTCSGMPLACGDGNACTADTCQGGTCLRVLEPLPGCCSSAADCDDGDACTVDECRGSGNCQSRPIPGCCNDDPACDDGDPCTTDACLPRNAGALVLDGVGGHVTVGRTGDTPFGENADLSLREFTIELWFRWDGTGAPTTTFGFIGSPDEDVDGISAYPLVTKGRGGGRIGRDDDERQGVNYFLGIRPADAEIPVPVLAADFEEHLSGSAGWAVNHRAVGSTGVSPDTWHHAAATYDGRCWELYLDGAPETDGGNCPAEPPAYENLNHLAFGTAQDLNGGVAGRFGGMLDEVRIWNRALSRTEIDANRFRQVESAPGLVGRWALDGYLPGSTVATADSAGDNPGIVVGARFAGTGMVDLGGGTCAPPVAWPPEVTGLLLAASATTDLSWNDLGGTTAYDVVAGELADLRAVGTFDGASCLASGLGQSVYDDVRASPSPGAGRYYLVRAVDACGLGTFGDSGSDVERVVPASCP